jgi:hypothetical protein
MASEIEDFAAVEMSFVIFWVVTVYSDVQG